MHVPYDRGGFRFYLLVLGLLAGHATPLSVLSGIPFLLVGIGIHLWSKGCLHQNQEVTTSGPYRFVRHPFYVGNALIDLAIALMSAWPLLLFAFPLWWIAVYWPTVRREEGVMAKLFGERYREYARRVPALIPSWRPCPRRPYGFSWSNRNILGTELPRSIRFLSYPLLFLISSRLHEGGIGAMANPTALDVGVAGLWLVLSAAGWELKRHFGRHRAVLPPWATRAGTRVAALLCILITVWWVRAFELESGSGVLLAGCVLMALSLTARSFRPSWPIVAEGLLLVSYAILCEVVWVAVLLVPLYLAFLLDRRLLESTASPEDRVPSVALVPGGLPGYYAALVGVLALALAKEWFLG